jgi:hypothetical protein
MIDSLSAYKDGGFHYRKHTLTDGAHEFCPNDTDEIRCRFCGGYPFDLRHWTDHTVQRLTEIPKRMK